MAALEELLSPERLAPVRRPLARAETLPPAAYTSPEVYAREEARLFSREWICAGRADQVPEPGDYQSVDLLGHRLVLVRGDDRRVRVLSRICRHRFAELVRGRGRTRSFSCPYHRWTYRLDGTLLGAPMMDEVDFDKAGCRLPELRSETWGGWVFVNLDPDAEPLAPRLAPLARILAPWRLDAMVAGEPLVYDSPFNWKILVENFMESYHHIGTHAESLERIFPARASWVEDNGGGPWSLLRMPPGSPDAAGAEGGLPPVEGIEPPERDMLVAGVVYPFHLFALTGSSMAWYQVLPDTVGRFELRIHLCLPRPGHEDPALETPRRMLREITRQVHEEDISACTAVWEGVRARGTAPGRLHRLEGAIWQQNQWWAERMVEGPRGDAGAGRGAPR